MARRASIGLIVIKCFVILYDIISYPIYYLIQRPWVTMAAANKVRARRENEDDLRSPYIRLGHPVQHYVTECKTIPEAQQRSLLMNGKDSPALGYRTILAEEEEKLKNGKVLKKYVMTDYQWLTIGEVDEMIGDIARGLLVHGVKPKDNVLIFAETRYEWFLSAQAILRIGATLATLYASLGEEAIIYGINEIEVTHIITTHDLVQKLRKVKSRIPNVKTIIYIEGVKPVPKNGPTPQLVAFRQLISDGKNAPKTLTGVAPQPEDTAVILYTSGSTGNPKGVVLTHKNLMSAVSSLLTPVNQEVLNQADNHRYLAYLPLAHSLELVAEIFMFSAGIKMGYGTAFTLVDSGTAIRKGDKGDISLLKPTVMPAVPLILDRIRKTIFDQIEKRGPFAKELFNYAINYKSYWDRRGFRTPIVNKYFCGTIRKFVGGELKFMLVGGAPLSPDTQKIMKSALNVNILQGFGSTETCAATTIMDFDDLSYGRIGAPLHGNKIKLIDWEEGGYRVTDKPNPRGEIVAGGDIIAKGYFKLDDITKESFEDKDGIRWFYMGDIGEVDELGRFKIIDRKKDLVKLQFGEYISLGKVETELKNCRYVENICVYGNSFRTHLVALVVPNVKEILKVAEELGLKADDKQLKSLYKNEKVLSHVLAEMTKFGLSSGLNKTEIPAKIKLCSEEWNPQNGFLTAALKLKRKNIENYYKKDIDLLYGKDSSLNNNNNN